MPCAFSILTSWRPACSPARRAGVRGLYIGGAAYGGDSAASSVCVVACQVLCACVGWSVVSLLSMRHSSRHSCTRRGGGCCVRGEGAVGVLGELDLGFLFFTSQSGCYSIVVCETRCVHWSVRGWKHHYDGSSTTCSLLEHAQRSVFVF